jgi:hypothetical protein
MDTIKWIQTDIARGHLIRPWTRAIMLAVGLFFPILFGLLLRQDFNDVFALRVLIPNLVSAMLMIFAFKSVYETNFNERLALKTAAVLLVLSVFIAAERTLFPAGPRTTYPSPEIFWSESQKCFRMGAFATTILGLYFASLSYLTASWPSRSYRALIASAAAVSGMVTLSFHCDSSSVAHVFLSHFGQGVIIGFIVFFLQEVFYFIQLKRKFPELTAKIKNPGNLSS